MRIIMLGAPGSGKGTQARFITDKYNIPNISTGDILRNYTKFSYEFNKSIVNTMSSGKLVNDQIVINLVKERIKEKDCINGFLLDGFPRTLSQAKAIYVNFNYIIELEVPIEITIDRVLGRLIHKNSGRIYNIKFNPPKVAGKDDITGEELITRLEDNKNVIYNRLVEYYQIIEPIKNFYKEKSKFNNFKYIKIDGTKSIFEIKEELETLIK